LGTFADSKQLLRFVFDFEAIPGGSGRRPVAIYLKSRESHFSHSISHELCRTSFIPDENERVGKVEISGTEYFEPCSLELRL
jgi:hypothetical protein